MSPLLFHSVQVVHILLPYSIVHHHSSAQCPTCTMYTYYNCLLHFGLYVVDPATKAHSHERLRMQSATMHVYGTDDVLLHSSSLLQQQYQYSSSSTSLGLLLLLLVVVVVVVLVLVLVQQYYYQYQYQYSSSQPDLTNTSKYYHFSQHTGLDCYFCSLSRKPGKYSI